MGICIALICNKLHIGGVNAHRHSTDMLYCIICKCCVYHCSAKIIFFYNYITCIYKKKVIK